VRWSAEETAWTAWGKTDAAQAERELRALAKHLEVRHPRAAASILEGLEETLTVTRLGLPPSLLRTFKTANPVESMISIARDAHRSVKRWRPGEMPIGGWPRACSKPSGSSARSRATATCTSFKRTLERDQDVVEGQKKIA
jgi:putative transposase